MKISKIALLFLKSVMKDQYYIICSTNQMAVGGKNEPIQVPMSREY